MAESLVSCEWLKEQLDKGNQNIRILDGMVVIDYYLYSLAVASFVRVLSVISYTEFHQQKLNTRTLVYTVM